jgi:predicted phage baseplate assembly protein
MPRARPIPKILCPSPHTQLTLETGPSSWPDAGSITARFDWIGAGQLLDQPPGWWSGTPSALVAASATRFRAAPASPVLLQDQNGVGVIASAASAGDFNVQLSNLPSPAPSLAAPIDIFYNTLKVSRGKTVAKEILGSGDATRPNQSFTLAQSPVTWLQKGATAVSTVALHVDGEPWTEVASFYDQPADARIFVTREDVDGRTHIDFGDGINGARLPTGINNIVADYRVGAGASSPAAGKLTVIAQPFPGLRALLNPVAVGGGADAEPASQIRRYAPRSVLTFGRAVSVFDYEALAAQAPGVSRARATWSWSNLLQRAAVIVYVGDDKAAADSARDVLKAAGDPNRPVRVEQAVAAKVSLTLSVLVTPGWDEDQIDTLVTAALLDPERGLFSANRMAIGQTLFDSQIEQAVLAIAGTVAIAKAHFAINGIANAGPLHSPGESGFFTLDPLEFTLSLEADTNGG